MIKPLLVFNAGSSSIKFSVYQAESPLTLLYEGEASGIGTPQAQFKCHSRENAKVRPILLDVEAGVLRSLPDAVRRIVSTLDRLDVPPPLAIGHRVVHSGSKLLAHQIISEKVLHEIKQATPFAPLHQPIALEIIQEAKHHFPEAENYACFDTIFHQTIPASASTYPLPRALREEGLHRYGFHGLSCESILQQFQDARVPPQLNAPKIPSRMILAHLGSGASVSAVYDGKSLDNSMGLTPCGGILMGTRSGDIDPGLIFYLLRMTAGSVDSQVDQVEKLLNQRSGILAVSELSSDMHILRDAEAHGNKQAALAAKMFTLSTKKLIGGYIALMGGVDTLVFTGGIGEHDSLTRSQICEGLETFGIKIDFDKNKTTESRARLISHKESRVAIYVLPSEENRTIALHVEKMRREKNRS